MSLELANEKWLDGHEDGLLGQFASTSGYSDLITAAQGFPALKRFFDLGATENIDDVRAELKQLIKRASGDVKSTAKALLDLSEGQDMLIITNGEN